MLVGDLLEATHLKFQSTVKLPQLATIQRSSRPLSVTHVNFPFCRGALPTCARSSGFSLSSLGAAPLDPIRLLKPFVSLPDLSCTERRQ